MATELESYLLEQIKELKAEREGMLLRESEAMAAERSAQTTIGLLRETVGALWIMVRATAEEAREGGDHLQQASYDLALADCEERMAAVNERIGTPPLKPVE
jgi:hypothetical protein